MPEKIHPVDQRLPLPQTFILGFQHVLVMYSACIIVPLILGAALQLPKQQLTLIINADLFASGIATLVQCLGSRFFGIRLPVMMGVTFASVTPMLAIAINPALGLAGVYGAIIVSGLFGIAFAPVMGRMLRFFPPVVTGTVLLVIGISLMRVGIDWSAGGQQTLANGLPNPDYGKPFYLVTSLLQLLLIMGINRFTSGFIANISVLLGVISGFVVAMVHGDIRLNGLAHSRWFSLITPFAFGVPKFDTAAIVSMCLVMLVTMVESTGMFLSLGKMTDRPVSRKQLIAGLRSDGLGAVIGGIFNAFPYTSFSQNIGLVNMTGVKSRYVCVAGAIILIGLGLFPKLAYIVASTPSYVLGAAGMVMFGMVALMGVRILAQVDFEHSRYNLLVVASSAGIGMIPLVSPEYFHFLPAWTHIFTDSGIILCVCSALLLNLLFNGFSRAENVGQTNTPGEQK